MNKKTTSDKFSVIILSAFFLMGAVHVSSRCDVAGRIDELFQKASAETVQETAALPEPMFAKPAAVTTYPDEELPTDAAVVGLKTIKRNPFLSPLNVGQQPLSNGNSSLSHSSGQALSPVAARPLLRGVIANNNKSAAIIEIGGTSGYYAVGQKVGNYTLDSIDSKSVTLVNANDSIELNLGRNK